MEQPDSTPPPQSLEGRALVWLVAIVTVAFLWILAPYLGAILWAVAAALVFAPLYRHIVRALKGRTTLAASATVALIFALVILPLIAVSALLAQEVAGVYKGLQSGEISIAKFFQQFLAALPSWATSVLENFGLAHQGALQERMTGAITRSSQQMAEHALSVGQNTFEVVIGFFVMLYLIFFLLRDGAGLTRRIKEAIPLRSDDKRELSEKFTTVIRATVKGNIVVALIQGTLGGLAFWVLGIHAPVLWGVVMAFLSLLPAIGAAIVWLPVAAWLLATGAMWKAVALVAWGVFVIGLVDNLLRPVLVGKDTRMPDYVVLLTTLGGMTFFGINGFVIGPLVGAMFMAAWHIFSVRRAGQR